MTDEDAATEDTPQSRLESFILGAADERRHRRVVITLPVRFMAETGEEHRAMLFDMSPGGISLTSDLRPEIGARLVLYIEDIGRCEGAVVRHHEYGFALRLIATQNRRDRIAERLTFHANRHRLRDDDLRMHERTEHDHQTRCLMPDGAEQSCRVIDLSLTGAAIALDRRPVIGAEVVIGRIQGRVVRHLPQGIAIRFLAVAPSHRIAAERLTST
ncbi:MAG: PilZ domain-containing protein [Micropepsaceae bacterium]